MKKLKDKKFRLKILKKVLAKFEEPEKNQLFLSCGICTGICGELSEYLNSHKISTKELDKFIDEGLIHFPEIYRHRPKRKSPSGYWFPQSVKGREKRVVVLRNAVEELQNEIIQEKENKNEHKNL